MSRPRQHAQAGAGAWRQGNARSHPRPGAQAGSHTGRHVLHGRVGPARIGCIAIATAGAQMHGPGGRAALGTSHAQRSILGLADALGIQQLVKDAVLGLHQRCQRILQGLHGPEQMLALHAAAQPLLDQMQADGLCTEHVLGGQFMALQCLDTQTHGLETGLQRLSHGQGHAGGKNLVFDDLVAEQLEGQRSRARRVALRTARGRLARGLLQRLSASLRPRILVLLKANPGLAPLLHFLGSGDGTALVGEEFIQLLSDLGQALTNAMDPTQARLPAQLLRGRRRGGGRLRESHSVSVMAAEAVMHPPQWSKRQTTAPALGSLGSCDPGLAGALTRSSRLTPSHMAMAAATNTEE